MPALQGKIFKSCISESEWMADGATSPKKCIPPNRKKKFPNSNSPLTLGERGCTLCKCAYFQNWYAIKVFIPKSFLSFLLFCAE